MLLVLAGLGYWNYKRVHVGWNVWRRNLSVLALALAMVGVFTATIYRCPWELLAPVDSLPGPVRISAGPAGSGLPVVRTYSFGVPSLKILIVLPDGRVWVNRFCAQVTPSLDRKLVQDPLFGGGRFIQGSDWKCADLFRGTLIAIRRDGSLWISDSIEAERSPLAAREIKMNQIGTEKDWKGLSSGSFPGYLVKNDGTLWCWRFHEGFGFGPTAPYQVGSDSDWDGFQRFDDWRTVCRKINGEAWVYSSRKENKPEIRLTENMSLFREPALEKKGCKDVFLFQTDHNGSLFSAGVCEDGMLREVARPHPDPQSSYEILESQDIQIGTERDWAQVIDSGYYNQPIVRKADGTLWKWSFKAAPHDNPRLCSASRLGTRSDWVAGARNVTLGADGSLWGWSVESELYWPGNSHSLLQGSRRPEYLGNIFGSPR